MEQINSSVRALFCILCFVVITCYITAYVEVKEYVPLLSKLIYLNFPQKNLWLQNMLESENGTDIFHEKVYNYLRKRGKITTQSTLTLLKEHVPQIQEPKDIYEHQSPGEMLVPKVFRIQHRNQTWNGKQLPLFTAAPNGRTGNVMGEYITLFALHKLYNVSVMLSQNMRNILINDFPHLSINETVSDEDYKKDSLWHTLGNEGGTFSYGPFELAAAGLLGPKLFRLGGFGFEIQLFNLIREEVVREFTFTTALQVKADNFLLSISERAKFKSTTRTYIGFHIRRTDYFHHMQVLFNGGVPASDDKPFIENSTLAQQEDVFISTGTSATEDMAILASCNHTIITLGTYGFWCGYLAGGEVVYPVDTKLNKPYKINDRTYEQLNLPNFTPIAC